MRAPYDAFYGQPPAALTKFCAYNKKHTFYMSEAGSQFAKLQMSFVMLRGYELRWHTQFDWVIRLRTDMFFLAPLPHYASLSMGAHVPLGMVLPGFINDHAIIVSRQHAAAYFELASDWACNSSAVPLEEPRVPPAYNDTMYVIYERLRAHLVPAWGIKMVYALVRPGVTMGEFHLDCWRLDLEWFGSPWSGTANAKVKPRAQNHMAYFRDCCAFTPTQSACAARFGNGSSKVVRGR